MTTHDKVSALFGIEVADVLERELLLRPDTVETIATPTHWRVRVQHPTLTKVDYFKVPQNIRNEIKAGLWKNGLGECLFESETTARRNAKIASNAGFNTRVTAMVLVETAT